MSPAACLFQLCSLGAATRQDNCWGEELEEGETYCQNGGTCKNKIADYDCICIDGWTGEAALYCKRRIARNSMTGRCWAFRQGLHQLRWHVQPHVWRQDWVVAGPLRHALGGRPGLCTYLQHQLCHCVASLTAPARAGGVCAVRARKEGEMIDTLLTKQLGFAFTSA